MNIIEQLGGYDKANEVFLGNPETSTHYNLNSLGGHYAKEGVLKLNHRWQWFNAIDKQWYWDFSESNHIEIHDIKKALLEYRRQHNIFEVGDYVFHTVCRNPLLERVTWTDGKRIRTDLAGSSAPTETFVHANDEEIKAGKRL